MKANKFKPKKKSIDFNKVRLLIHPEVETALTIWQRFRPRRIVVDIPSLDKSYQLPLRLIERNDNTLYFINDFARVDQVLASRSSCKCPCLIMPESIQDIQLLAWLEVVKLVYSKGVNHPQLFKALKQASPKSVICKLMGIDSLTVDNYCSFAGITKTSFEYQQSKISTDKGLIGLPMSMDWLVD